MIRNMMDVERCLATLTTVRKDYVERLAAVKSVLDLFDSPQNKIPAIHIAGTSGKGSTAYYATELLKLAGYRVGLAVSPHVNSVAERAQVGGQALAEDVYCSYFDRFAAEIERHGLDLSYIEFLTVFAYWLFAELELDYIVIEVGLGGRLDPTNVIARPRTVRVITDIGFDHTEILGDTLTEIAHEKAGIIHVGDVAVTHRQPPEVMAILTQVTSDNRATLVVEKNDSLFDPSLPAFQQRNWTLARRTVRERLQLDDRPDLSERSARESSGLVIPGRFERFTCDGVTIILDAAHNPQKIDALVAGVKTLFPSQKATLVVAFGRNKQLGLEQCLRALSSVANKLLLTMFTSSVEGVVSATSPQKIAVAAHTAGFVGSAVRVVDDPYEAIDAAFHLAKTRDKLVVVTGSFYLIDGIRSMLLRGVV